MLAERGRRRARTISVDATRPQHVTGYLGTRSNGGRVRKRRRRPVRTPASGEAEPWWRNTSGSVMKQMKQMKQRRERREMEGMEGSGHVAAGTDRD